MPMSLFQRLEEDVKIDDFTSPDQAQGVLLDSILRDLSVLLNSMAGCCEIRPEYGLTDFNAVFQSHRDTAVELCRDIETQIEMFEPRLKNPKARIVDDPDRPLEFVFNVEAQLDYAGKTMRVRIDSVLDSNGKIRISA
ncbi:type VI secretion system lysozyme-like protein [Roseibium hamelinense]|uniref:Type VI secretion system lysozyme-like protein n=1 Tax=Roseibium hamelinense TaxID=150831 RepID=A0A562SE19_9HYPH|nr:type VI secretion system baseplate subunit TssE [Roseibium hamelinense]MTI42577.1 type VI secretion system baseplate subunit TssE [Roseibium hamelinense]TWI79545.1 type VI secretion system lysozyme-like protein [Roseibium hamelinense]